MKIKVLLASASLALAAIAGSAHATTYDFSYTFAGDGVPNYVTGSFTGTGPLNDITNISNVTMSFDGAALGTFDVFSYHPTGSSNCGTSDCFTPGGAVVSNDSSLSNFFFSNSSTDALTGNYFYVIQPWANPVGQTIATQYQAADGSSVNAYNGQYEARNFSVSAAPEPAAWALLMVAVGMIGTSLRLRRRRGAVAAA